MFWKLRKKKKKEKKSKWWRSLICLDCNCICTLASLLVNSTSVEKYGLFIDWLQRIWGARTLVCDDRQIIVIDWMEVPGTSKQLYDQMTMHELPWQRSIAVKLWPTVTQLGAQGLWITVVPSFCIFIFLQKNYFLELFEEVRKQSSYCKQSTNIVGLTINMMY